MKTSTLILGMGLLMLIGITEAVSQPTFTFYYNSYGDRLAWDVPGSVLYRLSRVYGSYDIIHARQIPSRGYIDFEVIIETRGRYVSVILDHYGAIMSARQIAFSHFDYHVCDLYCGYHARHYERFYRPRPTVIVNKYPHHHHSHGHGYGYGKGNGHGHYKGHNDHGYKGKSYDKYDHDKKWDNDGDRDDDRRDDNRRDDDRRGAREMERPRGSVDRSRSTYQNKDEESTGYKRGVQGTVPSGTRKAIVLNN